jgi:hypothetical protein
MPAFLAQAKPTTTAQNFEMDFFTRRAVRGAG